MESIFVFFYFVAFALIAGGAFAMMWGNIMSINMDMERDSKRTYWGARPRKHPEAPEVGEEVMYVDLSREKLEQLYDSEDS